MSEPEREPNFSIQGRFGPQLLRIFLPHHRDNLNRSLEGLVAIQVGGDVIYLTPQELRDFREKLACRSSLSHAPQKARDLRPPHLRYQIRSVRCPNPRAANARDPSPPRPAA